MDRTTKQQRALLPKPPVKKIVKRPKGDAERKKKEVEAKLAKAKADKKATELKPADVKRLEAILKVVANNFAIQHLYKEVADRAETSDKPEAKRAAKDFKIDDMVDAVFDDSMRSKLRAAKRKGLITSKTPFLDEVSLSKKISSSSNKKNLKMETPLHFEYPSAKLTGTTTVMGSGGGDPDNVYGLNDDFKKILKKNLKKYNKPAKEALK